MLSFLRRRRQSSDSDISGIVDQPRVKSRKPPNDYNTPQWRLVENDDTTTCQIKFSIPHEIKAPVYLYYKLTKFYQNHREYVESYDLQQLKGEAVSADDLDSDCGPLKTNSDGKPYYPCGLIANSMFNDTFDSPYKSDDETSIYNMTDKAISWSSDRSRYQKTKYKASEIVPPPNWAKKYPDGYTDDNLPDLSQWESLQVWMRTAGLPSFMKLARRNDKETLEKGEYIMNIGLNFPVSIFGGTKSMVITSSSIIGGRNLSLGIAYLVVAAISVFFGIVFLVKYIIQPRKLGDHSYLTFQDRSNTDARSTDSYVEPQPSRDEPRTVREIL
ncbi:Cell division control protein [Wickerhamomyces ciferrii]|uniref:Cell division control protein n=1 Tax=Wickerhamomyces ciferrii (strain ATCC 14091 / BCRC 22168 / CBS 111 / JCM 3599 / NBRC 0793 / NRRL Y-1031 F-60-10) TaxID=1206466 RepID=K0KSK6_WICCF|nr:Cell division control protein [Wickerhamomyces ciferrii]CCH44324.1 Cell division control protein [Wickerhamomyces ciferrii]